MTLYDLWSVAKNNTIIVERYKIGGRCISKEYNGETSLADKEVESLRGANSMVISVTLKEGV